MKSIASLKRKVSGKTSPSPEEAMKEKALALQLKKTLEKIGADRVSFVGSAARDTGLKGDKDIDLFVQFPTSLDEEQIVKKTFDFTRKHIKADWIVRYAEHPYLQARVNGFKVEVIPCFVAKPHAGIKSAVDRSPLHMDYLQKRLTQKQREDVRMLKQFLKNNGLYGAELAIRGFSGLVCEYLVLNYRSFEVLVESAAKWKPQVRIDIEGLSQKPFPDPLVIVDAIDKNRNAAAVVSEANVSRFIALCQAFARNPSEKFFFSQPKVKSIAETKKAWKKRGTQIALVEFHAPDLVEDILIPQLRKTQEHALKHMREEGFAVLDSAAFVEGRKAFMLFEFTATEKPPVERLYGPPAWHEKALAAFLKGKKALRGPFIEGSKVIVEIEGKGKNAFAVLEEGLKRNPKWGVASHLAAPLKKAKLHKNEKAFRPACAKGLQDYFFKREPWW